MFKKLIAVFTALTMTACSAIPVYADLTRIEDRTQSLQTEVTDVSTEEIGSTGGEEQAPNTSDSDEASATEEQPTQGTDAQDDKTQDEKTQDEKTQDEKTAKTTKSTKKQISKYQRGLAAYIRSKNTKLSKDWSITLAGYFIKYGDKYDVDPKVLMGLALRESNFRTKAKSRYGYKGIMQCGDAFARSNGYKPSDLYKADVSIKIAAKYIKAMKKKHKTYSNAICCYVCGSGAVAKGIHSREPGRSVMKVRKDIKNFLKKNGYA